MDLTLPPNLLLQDRYHIVGVIGGGGFSEVFEVQDEQTGTLKVLKVLNLSGFRQPQVQQKAVALFQREAEFLSRFRHPGVPLVEPDGYFVWVWDAQTSLHCLVMEKISGMTLQEWRHQQQPLTQAQAISWLRELVDILAHLHQRQVFHRDIKPSNIMLRPNGQLVLIDFGAVREITFTYLAKQQQQETGTAIISAGYTPSEQAEGRAVPQSDFFALGRTFVYLLTGQDPINLPRDTQIGELLWRDRILKAADFSPLFADLIDNLMAPFPGQRPQNSEAIMEAINKLERQLFLQRWIPSVIRSTRPHRKPQTDKQLRSNLLKMTLMSVLLTGGVNVWSNRIEISDAINNWGLDAYEAQNYEIAGWYYQLARLLDPQSPIANFNLGNLYEDRQQFDQARVAYETALQGTNWQELPQGNGWKALNNLARLYILAGEYKQAVPLLEQGLQLSENAEEHYPLLKNLGWAQFGLKQYDKAQAHLQQAIDLDPQQAAAHCLMAAVQRIKVNIPDALASFEQCSKYADVNDPDYRVLSELARNAFSPSEVQR